ncbi:Ig-like domain-containing protein [Spirosoma koreense]
MKNKRHLYSYLIYGLLFLLTLSVKQLQAQAVWSTFTFNSAVTSMTANLNGTLATVDAVAATTFGDRIETWATGPYSGQSIHDPQVNANGSGTNATSFDVNFPAGTNTTNVILMLNDLTPAADGSVTYELYAYSQSGAGLNISNWSVTQAQLGVMNCANGTSVLFGPLPQQMRFAPAPNPGVCQSSSMALIITIPTPDVGLIQVRKLQALPDAATMSLGRTCTNCSACVAPGTPILFSNAGNNTTAGYTTQYALTDASGTILSTVTSLSVAAPAVTGSYNIYAVNYNSVGTAPTLTPGVNITAIGGTCSASSTPLSFSVCGSPPTVTVSGQLWNDADGNVALNGSEAGVNLPLYVNLIDATGTVVGSTTISASGTYTLTAPASTTGLKLVLTNSPTASTPGPLPTGWVNTGETAGSGNTAPQSSTLGVIELTTGSSPVTGSNFGIEQLPTAGSGSATASNAGGSSPVTVPPGAFTSTSASTDTAPGSVTAIRITAFPANVTSLTINGAVYTSLPLGGIVVPTDGSGAPTVPVLVDPTNDGSPVSIPFVAIDNAGQESANTGTATLNALAVPPVASNDVASTSSGTPVGINVLSNDTPGGSALDPTSVRLIDPATSLPVTSLTIAGEGSYAVDPVTGVVTFTPLPTFSGVATAVSYTVKGVDGQTSNTATITVTVTPTSTPNPDVNTTYVGIPVPGNVSTNDKVPAGTTYGTPTASAGNPTGGTLTINPDGTYSFTGTTPGSYTYTVPVCAPGQTTGCPTEPLVITVLPYPPAVSSPAPPVALVDIASVKGDPTTPASVTVDVRANDRPETASGTLDPPTIVSPPTHGTATVGPDGNIIYTPDPGYYGDDVLTYQVCDAATSLCTTAQEVIHVLPPSSPNTTLAADDYVTTTYNTPVSGSVKGNDTDPEGNTQTITPGTMTTPAGSLTLNADGSYQFVPTPGYSGPVNFPYTTCDNGTPQACASATLYILVAPPAPDLTPVIYARPSTVSGTTNITYVVDVFELNGIATSGPITVKISKDPSVTMNFTPSATTVGGRSVQNSVWSLSGPSGGFYTLTTNQVIAGGGVLSFGLEGTLTPGATTGTLTVSTVIVAGSGNEVIIDNNNDADKIDYFQQ